MCVMIKCRKNRLPCLGISKNLATLAAIFRFSSSWGFLKMGDPQTPKPMAINSGMV